VSGAAPFLAFPACALVLLGLLRSPAARRIVSPVRPDRWHTEVTPQFGGIGIFVGLATGILVSLAVGAVPGSYREVLGILAGCSILFVFGLIDDTIYLPPIAKLAGQFIAAGVVLSSGIRVTVVGNKWVALAIAVTWLVGMTNAFNLLDNMDGLAASLAAIAALFFAIDAQWIHPNRSVLVLSLSVLAACAGFLPFNIWPGRKAVAFMGDSGSQTLGFALAAIGLASTWKVAETTVATLILPLFVLAVPILDTTLVTIVRLLEGRPIYQGGRDHTSHRLVLRGLSERRAVVLLAAISILLGATCLAYMVIHDNKITAIGVLLTFALLVQFGSFLAEVERQPASQLDVRRPLLRTFIVNRRRLIEVVVDGALIGASFYAAYVLRIGSHGTPTQKQVFLWTLPVILFSRYLVFIPFGLYRGVWRYAGARDAVGVVMAVALSEAIAYAFVATTRVWLDFPRSVFLIDLLLCTMFVGASRFWERAAHRGLSSLHERGERRRTLIVGAGRSGRSLMRELRETPGEQVVGFIDDDPRLWRRRLQGVPVLGTADEAGRIVLEARPDRVLVTIPGAPRERLDFVADACAKAGIDCRFLRQEEYDLEPSPALRADVD
jgi:UDP-GlcNAc:undecaprenyl-phosphate/decaprenyl-phosphate GlcNAc-1-phosphate transferase